MSALTDTWTVIGGAAAMAAISYGTVAASTIKARKKIKELARKIDVLGDAGRASRDAVEATAIGLDAQSALIHRLLVGNEEAIDVNSVMLTTSAHVAEVRRMALVFESMFGYGAERVQAARNLVGSTQPLSHRLLEVLDCAILMAPKDRELQELRDRVYLELR